MYSLADVVQHAIMAFKRLRHATKDSLTPQWTTNDAPNTIASVSTSALSDHTSDENDELDNFVFDANDYIGIGGYGQIYKGKYKNAHAAIKVTRCREMFVRECDALARVQTHPCVVELFGVQRLDMWIAMELATGDLYSTIFDVTRVDEQAARGLFSQMINALQHIHSRNVAHRDVKLDNWLTFPNDRIKLTDFGLALVYRLDEVCDQVHGFVGSRFYCAPEILSRLQYDAFSLDSWSVMVCLFAMVTGFFPFDEASHKDWRYSRIYSIVTDDIAVSIFGLYNRPCTLSASLRDLVHRVFSPTARFRPSIEQIKKHPWLDEHDRRREEVVVLEDTNLWRSCNGSLQEYIDTPRLCRMAAQKERSSSSIE